MSARPSILIVDDEPALVAVLEPVLDAAGYRVATAATGGAALARIGTAPPDIVLLDLGLPDMDGKDVIDAIRAVSPVPIIVISARHQEAEKIDALDRGGDDYVDKPFEIGELTARIRAALRRASQLRSTPPAIYRNGPLEIDLRKQTVKLDGDSVRLSPKEWALLTALAENVGQVVTHKRLLAAGWAGGTADTQYLRVYMGMLRQKLEADPSLPAIILTEPGLGYRLAEATG